MTYHPKRVCRFIEADLAAVDRSLTPWCATAAFLWHVSVLCVISAATSEWQVHEVVISLTNNMACMRRVVLSELLCRL